MTDKDKIKFIQRRNSDVAKRLILLAKEITSDALMTELATLKAEEGEPRKTSEEISSTLRRILSDWYRREDYSTDHAVDDIFFLFASQGMPTEEVYKRLIDLEAKICYGLPTDETITKINEIIELLKPE
jgi:hypothetical protein